MALENILRSVQSLSHVQLFVTPWIAARQASLSIHHQHPELSLRACLNSYPLSRWCHPTILSSVTPTSSCPQSLPASRTFPISWLFTSSGQCIGASALASVLAMNIQGWFPLGLIGLISLMSKCSQGSSLAPQFESIHSSVLSLLCIPALTFIHDYWKNHSFDYMDFCWQSDISAF